MWQYWRCVTWTWRAGQARLGNFTPPGSVPAQLLEKSEDADKEQRQNEVFWKIDLGATDKDLKDAPLDRGAILSLSLTPEPNLSLPASSWTLAHTTERWSSDAVSALPGTCDAMLAWTFHSKLSRGRCSACAHDSRASVSTQPAGSVWGPKRWRRAGVRASDGDGTVPLLSLGALCARHWREPRLNPAGLRVVTREFPHEPFYGLGELRCAPCSHQIGGVWHAGRPFGGGAVGQWLMLLACMVWQHDGVMSWGQVPEPRLLKLVPALLAKQVAVRLCCVRLGAQGEMHWVPVCCSIPNAVHVCMQGRPQVGRPRGHPRKRGRVGGHWHDCGRPRRRAAGPLRVARARHRGRHKCGV